MRYEVKKYNRWTYGVWDTTLEVFTDGELEEDEAAEDAEKLNSLNFIKVAKSASFFSVPEVRKVLEGCEVIFTSMARLATRLGEEFPDAVVVTVSSGAEAIAETYIEAKRDDGHEVEVITFGDLYELQAKHAPDFYDDANNYA